MQNARSMRAPDETQHVLRRVKLFFDRGRGCLQTGDRSFFDGRLLIRLLFLACALIHNKAPFLNDPKPCMVGDMSQGFV
jgi:hypothetical protein